MAYDGFLTNPPAAGALEFVEKITITGAAVGSIEFENLDGSVDGYYELRGQVELTNPGAPGGADRLLVLPNGFDPAQETVLTKHVGGAAPTEISAPRLAIMLANTRQTLSFRAGLWAPTGHGPRGFFAEAVAGAGAGNQDRFSAKGIWNNDASNIVSLELLLADNTNGQVSELDQFTEIALWKRPF